MRHPRPAHAAVRCEAEDGTRGKEREREKWPRPGTLGYTNDHGNLVDNNGNPRRVNPPR